MHKTGEIVLSKYANNLNLDPNPPHCLVHKTWHKCLPELPYVKGHASLSYFHDEDLTNQQQQKQSRNRENKKVSQDFLHTV